MTFFKIKSVRLFSILGAIAALMVLFQNCSLQKMDQPLALQSTVVINTFSDEPTFTEISEKLLKPRCVECHGSGTLNYTSYEEVMSSNTVVPGKPEESKLYQLVVSGEMPESGNPLTGIDIAALKKWIESGAKNDQPGSPPLPVLNLLANALNPNQISLSWSLGSVNTTSIVIERSTQSATGPFSTAALLNTAATSFNDTGLNPLTKYYYRVAAVNFYGQADFSSVVEVTTPNFPPIAPTGLSASDIQQTQLKLSWTDNSGDETEFRIEKSASASGPFNTFASATADSLSAVVSGLSPSTTYYFRVAAFSSGGGLSTYSNTVTVRTLDVPTQPPAAPGSLALTALSSSQISLTWSDNSNDETGFKIERALSQSGTYAVIATVNAGVTAYADSGLQPSTVYYYRVAAVNTAGTSAYTTIKSVSTATIETTAPNPPGSLAATANSSSQITLSWADNSSNETGFKIESAANSAGPFSEIGSVGAGVKNFVNGGLNPLQTVYYRVRAYNSVGNSSYTSVASATTFGVAPSAPSLLIVTANSSSQITLSWTDNSNNETEFKIERAVAQTGPYAEIARVSMNQVSYANVGLSAATTYYYRVSAVNSSGTSNASNIYSAATFGTYAWINANVIQPSCIECHAGNRPKGSYDMATYSATMTRVVPGNSAASLMYQQVLDGSMPKTGSLNSQQLNAIKTWIDSGGQNN